jgi:hypothetical protein
MPRNGDVNQRFGIYKASCCGAEIVIPEDVTFPGCAKHKDLPTEWMTITYVDRVLDFPNSESTTVPLKTTLSR